MLILDSGGSRPSDKGGGGVGRSPKVFFGPSDLSLGIKIRGAGLTGPSPRSGTAIPDSF